MPELSFLTELESILKERIENPKKGSYTNKMVKKGLDKVLQKVGEEAVEYIIDAKNRDDDRALNEAADLMYHLLLSLQMQNLSLSDVADVLRERHRER